MDPKNLAPVKGISRALSARTSSPEDALKRLQNVGEELVQLMYLVSEDKDKRNVDKEIFDDLEQRALGVEKDIQEARKREESEGLRAPSAPSRKPGFINAAAATPSEKIQRLDQDVVRAKNLRGIKEDKEQVNNLEDLRGKWENVIMALEHDCEQLRLNMDNQRRKYQLDLEILRKSYNDERKRIESLTRELEETKGSLRDSLSAKREEESRTSGAERQTKEASKLVTLEVEKLKQQLELAKTENVTLKQKLSLKQMEEDRRKAVVKLGDGDLLEENKELEKKVAELTEKLKKYKMARKKLKAKNEEMKKIKQEKDKMLHDMKEEVRTLRGTIPSKKLKEVDTTLATLRMRTHSDPSKDSPMVNTAPKKTLSQTNIRKDKVKLPPGAYTG